VQAGSDVSASGKGGLRSGLHLWAIGITLIVVILLGCGTTIWDLHRQTLEQSLVAVSNLGVVLGEQTERYVELVDRTLEDVQSRVADLGIASPDELTSTLRTEAMRNFLRERLANLPRDNGFTLLKADGHVLISTRAPPDMDLSDRDYYRHFVSLDDQGPFISAPQSSRVTGTPTVYIARRINGPDHAFLGLAIGLIDLAYLTTSTGRSNCRPAKPSPCCEATGSFWSGIPTPRTRLENGCRRCRLGISSSPGKAAPTAHPAFWVPSPRRYPYISYPPGRWSSMSRCRSR
jgi:hypothetical protein